MLAAALTPAFTSCSDDYLDLDPITDLSTSTVSGSMTGARAALVGLCNGMYRYADDYLGFNGPNGEPWILGFYAEGMGNACIKGIWTYSASFVNSYSNWTYMNTSSSGMTYYMWRYCYNLIDAANNILAVIDEVELSDGEEGERDYIKAAALSVRAHAYIHLLQCYAPRWADSNNGNAYCIVLRTEPATTENVDRDFSTMNQVLDQLYSDLGLAIKLYDDSDFKGYGIWAPDIDVARGLYARAAMLKNDYNTAIVMATAAMENHPIMSADQYRSGFIYANSEYIWSTDLEAQEMFWNTYGSWTAYNGYYTTGFGIGDCIDYDIYKAIGMTDCRKLLYFTPELMELIPNLNGDLLDEPITPESFFYQAGNETVPGIATPASYSIFLDGYDYEEDGEIVNDDAAYYLMDAYAWGYYGDMGYETALANYDASLAQRWGYCTPRFGFGMKFWGEGNYAFSNVPFMRASEMGYIVAEAQYMLGNESEAQQMMNYLNKDVRDPEYDCTLTGAELLAQIKAYREVELWGEGFNWFDLKRWGDPCTRNTWVEGDVNSGNWGPLLRSFQPSDMNGWVYAVPEAEFLYNDDADRLKLD